jgi:hypothetical protein
MAVLLTMTADLRNYRSATEQQLTGTEEEVRTGGPNRTRETVTERV